jgi:tetratricopeptide (TPR) repeat protein
MGKMMQGGKMRGDLERAIEYHKRGEYAKAREYYLRAVEAEPENARIRVLLGNTFYYDGYVEEGISQYEEAIRIDPDYAIAYYNLAIALEHKGDIEGAIKNYKKAIKKNPNYAEAYSSLGALLKECGEIDEAINCLRKALEIDKSLEAPRKKLQEILQEVHEQVRAREVIRQAEEYIKDGDILEEVGDLDRAIESYRKSIRIYPSIVGHFLLALALEKKGDMRGATENYRALLKLDISNIRDFTEETLNILGKRLGKLKFTNEDLVKMLKKLHAQVKERKSFISMIGYVIRESVHTAEDYIRLGSEYEQKGDLNSAVDYYRRAVELEPFSPMPYYILGLALERMGRMKEAVQHYQRAMELDIGSLNPEASQKLAETLAKQIGNIYVSFLDSRQLLREFKEYVKRSGGMPSFESFLRRKITGEAESKIEEGYMLDAEGTLDVAIQRYQEAVEIDPNNLVAHYILGLALESKGDYEGAIRRYRETEKVDLDKAPREISRRVIEILNRYLTRTTKDGHRVGTILMRYFEIISQNPEKMAQLLSYIEDIKLDTLSKILRSYVDKVMREAGGGVIIRDMEDFAENVEETLKMKRSEELSQVKVKLAWKYKTGRAIRCAGMSAEAEIIAGGSENGKIYCINRRGELLWKKNEEVQIVDIDVSPEGDYVVAALYDGAVELFDSEGKLVWKKDFNVGLTSLAISRNAEYIVVATRDSRLILLDSFGKVLWERSVDGYCSMVDISHSGREIVACSDVGYVYFIKNEGIILADSMRTGDIPYSVAVSPDGKFYACGSTSGNVYLINGEKKVVWKRGTMSPVYGIAVCSRGEKVVAGTAAGLVYLYDEAGNLMWKYPTGVNIWDTDISVDGRSSIAGCGLVFGDIYHFIT